MGKDIKHESKCCETCLNRASFSNGKHMCCKDCCEDLRTYGIPKELPDEHVCDKYSPDIANNPNLREPKPDTEISGFMSIFHEIENTDELPCKDGCTCHECNYFTKEDNRFMIDGVCGYYGIYLYDFVKNAACQHFKLKCCDDNSSNDTNSTPEPYDSYFKSFEAINADRTDEELADHYNSIDAMFKKDVEHVETNQNHDKKHFCSECIFCAMIEPDEDDQKTMYWAYTYKCLKTNLTIPRPDECEVCDKFVSKEDKYNNYLKTIEKPPLGIKPPYVFASERISDICEAILRLNQESVVVDTDVIRSYASELCAISDYLDACMK